jgi:hypothetical protein
MSLDGQHYAHQKETHRFLERQPLSEMATNGQALCAPLALYTGVCVGEWEGNVGVGRCVCVGREGGGDIFWTGQYWKQVDC